ncbi:TetR family transcriptional regulator C-terminal domain-containing protein [Cohnella xylanilytica]|nr:TetR family transcriptional regulator C-terminal domain-containing protein [Cohnella xylanilytica]
MDADLEAETLHALLDGLAIHQLLHPGTMPAERAELLLDRHLRSLCE